MQPLKNDPFSHSPHAGKSGLRDVHRRSLMRLIFTVTAIILGIFSVLQFKGGNFYLALGEMISVAVLMIGAVRVNRSRHLRLWIHAYLVPAFCFMVLIMVIPEASDTAFVWVFTMPVLAYLLLGLKGGFLLAAPFMLGCAVYYILQFDTLKDASEAIDLFNPIFCGLVILLFIHVYETMRSQAERQLVSLAETDALTGLPNRSSFQATLDRTISECRRSGNSFALVLMDIDHFKTVNDTLGHDAGDEALKYIARCLNQRLRSTDFVGRLGGEEFGLVLRDVDIASACQLVEELRQRIADSEIVYSGKTVHLTVTFGVAVWPLDADKATPLYQVADRRLYVGKHSGRNTVVSSDIGGLNPESPG